MKKLLTIFCLIIVVFFVYKFLKVHNRNVQNDNSYKNKVALYNIYKKSHYDIIMVGASIIEYLRWDEISGNRNILNRGIGGDTVEGVIKRLPEIYSHTPKKIILQIGHNNIGRRQSPEEIFNNYKILINDIKKHKIELVVLSVLYTEKESILPYENKVEILNNYLASYCKKENIKYIDINLALSKNKRLKKEYSFDGIHLNAKGYQKFYESIKNELN